MVSSVQEDCGHFMVQSPRAAFFSGCDDVERGHLDDYGQNGRMFMVDFYNKS